MIKERQKAVRREKQKSKQAKRIKDVKDCLNSELNERQMGRLRDHHYRCGCAMCKPWKHGLEEKEKPSERRKLQAAIDEE